MIAALYVQTNGVYYNLPNVDPWDEARDARNYTGPWPVVAHPPCERYGRYWSGGPSAKVRRIKGDDGGCFAAALASVREWGGVLEHPEASAAWSMFGLMTPPKGGGWVSAGMQDPGWTCCVEQGHYGHRARKATWLYAVGVDLTLLRWGKSKGVRLDAGYHSAAERRAMKAAGIDRDKNRLTDIERLATPPPIPRPAGLHGRDSPIENLGHRERAMTPIPFRDLLISIAESARQTQLPPNPATARERMRKP